MSDWHEPWEDDRVAKRQRDDRIRDLEDRERVMEERTDRLTRDLGTGGFERLVAARKQRQDAA
ncbi:MAG TPA: hypothetical protein VNJ54_12675 [Plantibacter sp.]|uniref:hypothetical protein n=1 Tax=Plantibacter sp. TaxID=1871045 RepID=UPI002C183DB4|nr:hypothetical protein [Plantibacter sp.]